MQKKKKKVLGSEFIPQTIVELTQKQHFRNSILKTKLLWSLLYDKKKIENTYKTYWGWGRGTHIQANIQI